MSDPLTSERLEEIRRSSFAEPYAGEVVDDLLAHIDWLQGLCSAAYLTMLSKKVYGHKEFPHLLDHLDNAASGYTKADSEEEVEEP